jgi:hypothetical protein
MLSVKFSSGKSTDQYSIPINPEKTWPWDTVTKITVAQDLTWGNFWTDSLGFHVAQETGYEAIGH